MKRAATALPRFIPRRIDPGSAAQGYNNEGRGKLIGYISDPKQHETSCPHFKDAAEICACRIGLWQEEVAPALRKRPKKAPPPETVALVLHSKSARGRQRGSKRCESPHPSDDGA